MVSRKGRLRSSGTVGPQNLCPNNMEVFPIVILLMSLLTLFVAAVICFIDTYVVVSTSRFSKIRSRLYQRLPAAHVIVTERIIPFRHHQSQPNSSELERLLQDEKSKDLPPPSYTEATRFDEDEMLPSYDQVKSCSLYTKGQN